MRCGICPLLCGIECTSTCQRVWRMPTVGHPRFRCRMCVASLSLNGDAEERHAALAVSWARLCPGLTCRLLLRNGRRTVYGRRSLACSRVVSPAKDGSMARWNPGVLRHEVSGVEGAPPVPRAATSRHGRPQMGACPHGMHANQRASPAQTLPARGPVTGLLRGPPLLPRHAVYPDRTSFPSLALGGHS